jgi:hypothetical protein
MNTDPSERALPDLMQGLQVIVEYMCGVRPSDEETVERVKQGEVLIGQPEARTELLHLDSLSNIGIEVSKDPEGGSEVFIPWSAVLALYGPNREELERFRRGRLNDQEAQQPGEENSL